jgi:hypothetical protein
VRNDIPKKILDVVVVVVVRVRFLESILLV